MMARVFIVKFAMPNYTSSPFIPVLAILGAVTALAIGTATAKHLLFPLIGAQGTTAVRVGFSALLLLLLWRPWRRPMSRPDLWAVACYGAALGMMNLCFYMSLRTIPFGVAVAIEFAGPLAVVLWSTRQARDLVWVACAITGLGLLLPIASSTGGLDPTGVGYALAAAVFWAAYIVFGKRLQHIHAGHSVSLGLLVAALVVVPAGLPYLGEALLSPQVLLIGLFVAAISSALPISLEMVALKRLPPTTFGILVSLEPAVAALMALLLLDEILTGWQWLAIGLIVTASAGSTWSSKHTAAIKPLAPER